MCVSMLVQWRQVYVNSIISCLLKPHTHTEKRAFAKYCSVFSVMEIPSRPSKISRIAGKATSTRHGNSLLEDEHCKISGIPIPFHLIMPIWKSVTSSLSSCQALYPNLFGYGFMYTTSLDPEPGRCRRTDGKKWRCRKGAVTGHKYCERHMHRGRDGQCSGKHAETKTATTITTK